jgi:hypothetical protein
VSKSFFGGKPHASDPFVFKEFLSLHGVVFDILVGSESNGIHCNEIQGLGVAGQIEQRLRKGAGADLGRLRYPVTISEPSPRFRNRAATR